MSTHGSVQMGCTNLEVLLAESLVRVDRLGLGQLLDRRRPHGLNTTSFCFPGTKQFFTFPSTKHLSIFLAQNITSLRFPGIRHHFKQIKKTHHKGLTRFSAVMRCIIKLARLDPCWSMVNAANANLTLKEEGCTVLGDAGDADRQGA
jgi:hypothetical protein